MGFTPDDLHSIKETVLIVQPVLPYKYSEGKTAVVDVDDQVQEANSLVKAINLDVVDIKICNIARPVASHLISKGLREDIRDLAEDLEPSVILVNHSLSPGQQRNLEKAWDCKVIDRTGLILEIFGARAQTKEGKIQVELAALEYQRSRLVRSWTHLERQRGGAGFMGGPGETQIEIDRRLIAERIAKLKKELETVRRTRDIQKRSRKKVPFPTVSLVGYTNAGKSTLFNYLTDANVFVKDLLFATLDTTMRKIELQSGMKVILSDTVGFIADLPTHLVAAFRATLEQIQDADVILHVQDIAHPNHTAHKEDVIKILKDLDIEYNADPRIIEVHNKMDLLGADEKSDLVRGAHFAKRDTVAISAITGEGTNELLQAIELKLSHHYQKYVVSLPYADGEALAWVHDKAHIISRNDNDTDITLTLEIDPADTGRFESRFDYKLEKIK